VTIPAAAAENDGRGCAHGHGRRRVQERAPPSPRLPPRRLQGP